VYLLGRPACQDWRAEIGGGAPGLIAEDSNNEFALSLTPREDNQSAKKRANDRKQWGDRGAYGCDEPEDIDPMIVVRIGADIVTGKEIADFGPTTASSKRTQGFDPAQLLYTGAVRNPEGCAVDTLRAAQSRKIFV
jgi:hypothetical protein